MAEKKTVHVHVIMTVDDRTRLEEVAHALHCSMSHAVRTLIISAHSMTVAGAPHCASGQTCFVPNMHAPAPSTAPGPGQPQ